MSKTKQRKSTAGKSIAIFFIVFIILEALIIFGLKAIFKTEDSTPTFGGYSFFLMDSDNMSPSVPKSTLVIAVNGTPDASKIGNAILCKNVGDEGTTVAWLNEIGSKGDTVNGVVYTVVQDNVTGTDSVDGYRYYDVESDDVVGVATSHYVTAGKIVSFIITPFGIAICLAVPLVMLVLLELVVAVTNRSDDDSYEDSYARTDARFNNMQQQRGQRRPQGQNGNVALDDFLYGGNDDDVYGNAKPNADYAEEFDAGRPQRGQRPQRPAQQRPAPDFSVNDNGYDEFEENDPFSEEDNGYLDEQPAFGGFEQPAAPAPDNFYRPEEEASPFDGDGFEEEDEVFAEQPAPAPAQPQVDREYYERAAKLIDGDDYKPSPAPAPAPAPVQQPQSLFEEYTEPEQPAPVQLDKPVRQQAQAPAPARQQAPRQAAPRAEQGQRVPGAPTPRRRPAQPQGSAPRRRPAGTAPSRQAAPGQRRRPPQQRPAAQRRAPHKDANAALADLMKKMSDEQQKLGNKQ